MNKDNKPSQSQKETEKDKKINLSKPVIKIIISNSVNLILIIIVVVLLQKMPQKAERVKQLENEKVLAQETLDIEVLNAEIENNTERINQIKSLFTSQKEVLDVIEYLSNMRNTGLVEEFNIADNTVKDKSGDLGLPVFIKGSGDQTQVDAALRRFHSMGKILKPVRINLKYSDGQLNFEYTAFLVTISE